MSAAQSKPHSHSNAANTGELIREAIHIELVDLTAPL
jgi:hypothetical protein